MNALRKPLLDKPAPSWSHDLPLPREEPSIHLCTSSLSRNHMDDIYLEIPRSTFRVRGVSAWLSVVPGVASFVSIVLLGEYVISGDKLDPILVGAILSMLVGAIWSCAYMWRMDTAAPRDEPIRLNRARQKLYVYRFHYDGYRIFSRTAWFTKAEVYDWVDLRAEACSIYGPMGSGGLIQTVTVAVVKPGTNRVLDRFHFAHGGLEGEMYWAMAQIYMQQGPHALPKFDRPPRDWNNEKITFNLARYLAPKVKWPEAIDVESRTAPEQTPDAT